ncbi:MAG: cellulase family glycosylhydrolase, partial [Deltaproteobacteria bacterium]|nr:cellulase family glycosylhydrolase [Deltaproteobacteria bacterium]
GLMSGWHPTFARMSLSMHSGYGDKDWNTNDTTYTVPTTNAINFLGSYSNMRVLVTLRSHSSMTETDAGNEATYIPTTNTDATYRALVDTFANSKFVIFGISNEPGTISWSSLAPVMDHAVSVIRNEEDQLKVPHHLVAVQGIHWTSDISYYDSSPLPYDNVVYEVHGYEPSMTSYTKSNIPVIIGEYGPTSQTHDGTVSSAFLADIEAKQIPNLAWTFEPYSNCEPSLLLTTHDSSNLTPTTWGNQVQSYLLQHNP